MSAVFHPDVTRMAGAQVARYPGELSKARLRCATAAKEVESQSHRHPGRVDLQGRLRTAVDANDARNRRSMKPREIVFDHPQRLGAEAELPDERAERPSEELGGDRFNAVVERLMQMSGGIDPKCDSRGSVHLKDFTDVPRLRAAPVAAARGGECRAELVARRPRTQ